MRGLSIAVLLLVTAANARAQETWVVVAVADPEHTTEARQWQQRTAAALVGAGQTVLEPEAVAANTASSAATGRTADRRRSTGAARRDRDPPGTSDAER